jgi:hypothetical protein
MTLIVYLYNGNAFNWYIKKQAKIPCHLTSAKLCPLSRCQLQHFSPRICSHPSRSCYTQSSECWCDGLSPPLLVSCQAFHPSIHKYLKSACKFKYQAAWWWILTSSCLTNHSESQLLV